MIADWVVTFVRDLGLAVWLGGLVVIDFVESQPGGGRRARGFRAVGPTAKASPRRRL